VNAPAHIVSPDRARSRSLYRPASSIRPVPFRRAEAEAKEFEVRTIGLLVLVATVAAGLVALGNAKSGRPPTVSTRPPPRLAVAGLHGAAALLALSVFADSGIEHTRGAFHNRGMFAPVLVSGLVVATNAKAMAAPSNGTGGHDVLHASSALLGVAGVGFQAFNLFHRPGGASWHNFFYAAPVGAPAAIALAGLIGSAADHIEAGAPGAAPTLSGFPAGQALVGLIGLGLAGTAAEVSLLHFRGSFNSPYMWLPVTLPPVAAALLLRTALQPERAGSSATRVWLGVTAAVGLAGTFFHARGISRMMGGWRNWSQNVADGPPVPAPPSFTALAIAGLTALALMRPADA